MEEGMNHALFSDFVLKFGTFYPDDRAYLVELLEQAKAIHASLEPLYENDDWGGPSTRDIRRLNIAIKAIDAGAKSVENVNAGIMVNNWLLIAASQPRWSYKHQNWYNYGSLDELLKKHVTDKLNS